MAFEEYVKKAISTGVRYDKLPERVRATLSSAEYRSRVREYCIQKGLQWDSSLAREVCTEQDYYDELVRTYKSWARLYPYHLASYVARVMRITPFKYYNDVLFMTLKDEKSYDRIPNFTAADALRVTGVGRNEYIAIMNACKAKKLMWRVNKGIAKDLLPAAPLDIKMEGWWVVNVVNVGDAEFRELSPAEANLLRQACEPQQQQQLSPHTGSSSSSTAGPSVSNFDVGLLQQLYKRGVIYLDVPVSPNDRLSVPPLEGFVSNKTSEVGDESVDPFEPLLYNLFLANSSRLDQARLADILGVELQQLLLATSIAIRLGFATKLQSGSTGAVDEFGVPIRVLSMGPAGGSQVLSIPDSDTESLTPTAAGLTVAASTAAADSSMWEDSSTAAGAAAVVDSAAGAVAVVVDAEATSYLMMGALSPGLKRHSVTLFEGGRVGGAAVIDELITELAASAEAGQQFEGDMVQLMQHIQSLGILLAVVRSAAAAQGHQLELLRKESLEGLDPVRAAKVLSHAYTALLPIAPMPGPQLPINPLAAGSPTLFGPTAAADSPWLQLALYSAARCGPVSLVVPAGQRVWKLPGQLEGTTHALLWGWSQGGPLLVEGTSLLYSLNELLCRTAVMVQPLVHSNQLPNLKTIDTPPLVSFIDVPLPLCPLGTTGSQQQQQQRVARSSSASSWDPFDDPAAALAAGPDAAAAGAPSGTASGRSSAAATPRSSAAAAGLGAGAAAAASSSGLNQALNAGAPLQQQQQQSKVASGSGSSSSSRSAVLAVDRQSGKLGQFIVPDAAIAALEQLQLTSAIGWLRLIKIPSSSSSKGAAASSGWLPLTLNLGVPLFCPLLCQQICNNLSGKQCLTAAGQTFWKSAQQHLQQQLWQLVTQYGVNGSSSYKDSLQDAGGDLSGLRTVVSNSDSARPVTAGLGPVSARPSTAGDDNLVKAGIGFDMGSGLELPARTLLFDGMNLVPVDVGDCLQGVRSW